MGEPVGDQTPPGDGSTVCWGPKKPFGDVPTPKIVYLTFTGLVGDYVGANKTFTATQSIWDPNVWNFNDGSFFGFWWYRSIQTIAKIGEVGDPFPTRTFLGGICTFVTIAGVARCTIS